MKTTMTAIEALERLSTTIYRDKSVYRQYSSSSEPFFADIETVKQALYKLIDLKREHEARQQRWQTRTWLLELYKEKSSLLVALMDKDVTKTKIERYLEVLELIDELEEEKK